jgi:hypothetical protein
MDVRCIFEIACKKHCTTLDDILKITIEQVLEPSLHICQEIRSHYAAKNEYRNPGGPKSRRTSDENMSAKRHAGAKF